MTGNSPVEETVERAILAAATGCLAAALPPGWSISTDTPERTPWQPDAQITITPPQGPSVTMTVEVRRLDRGNVTRAVRRAVMAQELTGLPAVVVTEYANPALRAVCAQKRINYLDTTGWIQLHSDQPALFISTQGASRPTRTAHSTTMTRLNGPGAARMIRALLEATTPIGVRALAAHAGVSPGSVAKLLPALTVAGAIERDENGQVLRVRPRVLLERWTQDYSFRTSNAQVSWFLAPRGINNALSRLPPQVTVALTGSPAARRLLPEDVVAVAPLILAALYTDDPTALARQLGLVPAPEGTANVVLARSHDATLLVSARPPAEPITGQAASVPVPQVLADLMTLPGRSAQEAEQIMDLLARTDPRWAEDTGQP